MNIAHEANKLFDRWIRDIQSNATTIFKSEDSKKKFRGEYEHPRVNSINLAMGIDQGETLKDKPIPIDRLTT